MIAFALLIGLAFVSLIGAVRATIALGSTVIETIDTTGAPFGASGGTSITHSGLNKTTTYDANSNPTATKVVYGQQVLTAGAATINLAAVPGLNGVAVDLTGLRIRSMLFRAKSDNANPITVGVGAANGFTGAGAAFELSLTADKAGLVEPDTTAVAAGNRTLDVSGTGAQVLNYMIVAGG